MWYNKYVKRTQGEIRIEKVSSQYALPLCKACEKIFEKLFKNLLTNHNFYGIIYMSRGEGELKPRKKSPNLTIGKMRFSTMAQRVVSQKIFEKLFKNLLTKATKCGIIYM